ncbi:hypothetical protein N7448_009974 [Penicillium atrosanguineum]|nr:hypothetical protein N7448_009974 [Penicillium atrosanguineum]
MKTSHGNFLTDPFQFDHEYFGISPREAKSMDPQQKLLLQGAVHAMEDAGYVPNGAPSFNPETMGCYIGVATNDYVQNLASEVDVYYSTGTLRAFLSGKISYAYSWGGPSVTIDTACSSSLVSVVAACRALAHDDCTTALAGGVNAITSPDMYLGLSRAHFLGPTGQCKPFDVSADGYCRAEGCGLFVIKRLSDAIHEGDRIYGVIKEADINQCGNASSITHPDGHAQKQLFQKLLSRRNTDPSSINVIEAHGTGTQASSFSDQLVRKKQNDVKGNIGHAEAASGAAGLAKLLMMLKFSKIPPQVGFNAINPKLQNLAARNIQIPTTACEWKRVAPNLPRRALLNNFGAAGSNAALIVEEYRSISRRNDPKLPPRAVYPLTLSARNAHALRALIDCYSEHLRSKKIVIQDFCYTATARRQKHQHILSLYGGTISELVKKLQLHRDLENPLANYGENHPIVFVFSGQGSFYSGMGQQLMLTVPVFKSRVKDCDHVLEQNGFDITPSKVLDGSFSPESAADCVLWSQVACFVLEYALACLWMAWNIKPDAVISHSLGEYSAMVISGTLSLQDALLLIVERARLMASSCQVGESTMLACNTSAPSIKGIIRDSGLSQLTVACDNSVTDSVVSGRIDQVDQLARLVKEKGIRCKWLDVPLGFHSSALDAMLPKLQATCEGLSFSSPSIPLGSCLHGRLVEEGDLNSSYPVQQTRGSVRFTELIESLLERKEMHKASFIEIGPSPITLPMIRAKLSGQDAIFLPSIAKGQDPWITMSQALQQLSLRYNSIQWRAVFDGTDAHVVDLPDYPFQTHSLHVPFKESALKETVSSVSRSPRPPVFHLLEEAIGSVPEKGLSTFSTSLGALSKYIEGHSVNGSPLCPASVYHEMVLEAMHSKNAPAQHRLAVVSNIEFGHPLVYSPEKKSSTVILTTEEPPIAVSGSNLGSFKFVSPPAIDSNSEKILCTGQTAWQSSVDAKAYLARKQAYANRQMRLLKRNRSQTNTLHRNVIYNIIFPRVVAYSEPYQSITELHVAEGDLEGYGKFEVPTSALSGGIVSPVFIDTLLHAAGFVVNSQAKPTEAFICSKVDSTVVLYADINPQDTFLVYCSLLEYSEGERIGEAFAMTLDGEVVASIEGMVFKRLNLRSFASHLSRQAGQKPTNDIQERSVLPRSKLSTPATRPSGPTISDPTSIVADLISKLCEQPREMITPEKRLEDLGIDSLMQIEFSHSLFAQFPQLNPDDIMGLETVRDIQKYIVNVSGGQFGVSFIHDELSNDDSDHSDNISSTTASGRLTPATELNANPKDVTDCLMQLVAETCGCAPSNLSESTALHSLGMDSLMSIEFQEGMKKEFCNELPQEMFSPTMTIGKLAKMLVADISLPSSEDSAPLMEKSINDTASAQRDMGDFVVHLQQGHHDRPPLILLHDDLAVQPHWAVSLKDMASRYAGLISSVIKAKEVVLGGWSFGGILAHEVAQQLDKKGHTTVAVILIDSPCPLNHQSLPSQMVDYILGPKKWPQTMFNNISSQFHSHAQFLADYSIQKPIPLARKYVMLHSKEVFHTTRLCGVSYPWLESQQYRALELRQWESLLNRPLIVYDIPGNHFEPFNSENVEIVSEKLKNAYDQVVEAD